jgi:hypothetical protein
MRVKSRETLLAFMSSDLMVRETYLLAEPVWERENPQDLVHNLVITFFFSTMCPTTERGDEQHIPV